MTRNPVFLALARSSRLLGLPYGYAILGIVLSVIPLIWFLTWWTLAWCAALYVVLRLACENDDRALDALLRGLAAIPPTQGRRIFGGDSYGP